MDGNGHKLLLIQRDDLQRAELVDSLIHLGYSVVTCDDGEEGLNYFHGHTPEAVLLDMYLPSSDGREILKQLTDDASEVPVIAISRRKLMSDVVAALRHGACDYLLLPDSIKDTDILEHALQRAMAQGALKRENRAYRQKLENANRDLLESLTHLQKDQQAGRHVQSRMLPETPKIIGKYSFCHRILPSLYLSGDFIDYFLVGDRHAVFFIADVSGHGASSAFVTVILKNLFARKRSDYHHRHNSVIMSPAHMLERANSELLDMDIDKHVTMCVGVLNVDSGELLYSVAGHLPAPVMSVDGKAQYLECHDLPVGLFPDATYTEQQLFLPENAVLTLFSDGILEVLEPSGVRAKEEYLLEALGEGWKSADEVVNAFNLDQVTEAPDDIAVLVVSRV